ncbi:hypothetical protein AJ80_02068 [Polytolypa hystricis UAMH7299]|uniref:tRNA (guanine(9)-N1)-methyltransferase n=1 Tax=Polytolypa hystricis (strain UAMH7299) TaxID=1447883 RepID=A0A2B7YRL7_POLH7|nr:hypothetical protein AJ80_02068 [Polytolypa hystricis UAMH7299]
MEAEERPRKLQKVEHDATAPVNDDVLPPTGEGNETNNDTTSMTQYAEGDGEAKDDQETPTGPDGQPLSKNQFKKLKKKERWEAGKEWRKEKRKEKMVAKRERQRAAKAQAAQDGAHVGQEEARTEKALCRRDRNKLLQSRSTLLPIALVIDCDFDDLMLDKEVISLAAQVTRAYSDNSKARYRAHLTVSSFNKRLKVRFDTALRKQYPQWKGITFTDEDFVAAAEVSKARMTQPNGGRMKGMFAHKEIANPEEEKEVIYLSSDSSETLTELKPYHTYIIGGLVDKNRHKGVCYRSAVEKGVKTAKLPIGEYMDMASRFVLTTNHVVEIMLKWLELGDWGQAFDMVLPKRKGGILKGTRGGEEDSTPCDVESVTPEAVDAEGEHEGIVEDEANGTNDSC